MKKNFPENSLGNFPQPHLERDLTVYLSFVKTQISLFIRAKIECNLNRTLLSMKGKLI